MATDTAEAEVELITANATEEAVHGSNGVIVEMEQKEKSKDLLDVAPFVQFEKPILLQKIEKDVHDILDENVGWRLRDEKYKTVRKLHDRFPKIGDKEMMDIVNMDFTDLTNAYNKRCALDESELKHLIRRNSDRKLIKQRYPLPVFSNKIWKMTTKSDGCLFFEFIFEFLFLPIYLLAHTLFMFCYLVRGELPVSGCTDLVLKDHFDVRMDTDWSIKRRASLDTLTEDALPTGYAVKNICKRERPSHTACLDVFCCCCRGVKVRDYIYRVKAYKKRVKAQMKTLKGAQIQRITLRIPSARAQQKKQERDSIQESLAKADEERQDLLLDRSKSYCGRTSCCCMCPTAWQMSPLLDVAKDGKSKAKRIYWTVGWFNNCTPYDLLSWCFSSERAVNEHRKELNLLGAHLNTLHMISCGDNPTLIMLFRLLLCCCISVAYLLLWTNAVSCVWFVINDESILFYDFSDSRYQADCVMEGVIPFVVFALTAVIICFWASFRANIKVPNIKKLARFKIHWYDFSNASEEEIMRQTVRNTSFMNNRTGDASEREMLQQIEASTTTAMHFIATREAVFRKRVTERIYSHKLLRFRHDNTYSLGIRTVLSLIIALLPILYRATSETIDILEFGAVFTVTSAVLTFCTVLLFFSFIQHQIFFTHKLDLFAFILRDLTAIIKWPEGVDSDDVLGDEKGEKEEKSEEKVEKLNDAAKSFGFTVAVMDKYKETSLTADAVDSLASELDLSSLPYCNVLEHGNALSWVEMRSWAQGMIKALLSKIDMLLILMIILLFLDASVVIWLVSNHSQYGNQQLVVNGIIFGAILFVYLGFVNLMPLLFYAPRLKKLQRAQISSLEKQKLIATNIVNNSQYFRQFRFRDKSGLWDGKLKKFAPRLGIGFLETSISVVAGGDLSTGVLAQASTNLFLKSTGVLAAAAFPSIINAIFGGR